MQIKKLIFKIIVSLLIYAILLLPIWWPEVQVYKAGKRVEYANPMYAWAYWWSFIGIIALFWLALDRLEQLAGKLYDWLRE